MLYVQSLSEINWNRNSLFDSRVSFKSTMSIKVCLIKNILITESNQHLTANMRLTTREYSMRICTVHLSLGENGSMALIRKYFIRYPASISLCHRLRRKRGRSRKLSRRLLPHSRTSGRGLGLPQEKAYHWNQLVLM